MDWRVPYKCALVLLDSAMEEKTFERRSFCQMKVFSWVYHGKNKKQCYYRPQCLVCYVKLFFELLKLRR